MILATTPLATRISRWCESGKAKSIALHPQDYYTLSRKEGLIDKIEKQYSLPVVCLGGESGLKKWEKENTKEGRALGEDDS